jgi:hypothetical protein
MLMTKNSHQILSVGDWFQYAPPKRRECHWVDGRSAKELAKAFFRSGALRVPEELGDLLASSSALGPVQLVSAWPEHSIRLDSYRGEPRNADLAAVATASVGPIALTIEAKADETYGATIAEELAAKRERSNLPKRIESLGRGVLAKSVEELGALRYQLLHATAATLIFAHEHRAAAAIFVVLEFRGPSCSRANLDRNAADLNAFLRVLSPNGPTIVEGRLCGPFSVPGGGPVPSVIPLFVGKTSLKVR